MATEPIHPLKTCTKCGALKPKTHEYFSRNGKHSEFKPRCKDCDRAVYCGNRERFRELNKANYEANKDTRLARHARWRGDNPDRVRGYYTKRRETHKDHDRERFKKWRAANREVYRAARRRKYNPERQAQYHHARRARTQAAGGHFTAEYLAFLADIQKGACYYCLKKMARVHVDHFVPLIRGGTNAPDNIVLSCPPCNQTKHAKLPWDWMPERFSPGCTPR